MEMWGDKMTEEEKKRFARHMNDEWRKKAYEKADTEQRKRFDEGDVLVKEINALTNKTYKMGARHAIDIAKDCLKSIMGDWEEHEDAKNNDYVAGVSYAYVILDQLRKEYDE